MIVKVSAHAILRYFERIEGVDVAAVRQRMIALGVDASKIRGDSGVVHWMEHEGGYHVTSVRALFDHPKIERAILAKVRKIRVDDDCWAVLADDTVVSILTNDLARPGCVPGKKAKRSTAAPITGDDVQTADFHQATQRRL